MATAGGGQVSRGEWVVGLALGSSEQGLARWLTAAPGAFYTARLRTVRAQRVASSCPRRYRKSRPDLPPPAAATGEVRVRTSKSKEQANEPRARRVRSPRGSGGVKPASQPQATASQPEKML